MKPNTLLMKYLLTLVLTITFGFSTFAQLKNNKPYFDLLRQADSAYQNEQYDLAVSFSRKALKYGDLGIHSYILGCYYALIGNIDSAFYFQHKAINQGYRICYWLPQDSDLELLRTTNRWDSLMEHCLEKSSYSIDTTLASYLFTLKGNEQKYRLQLDTVLATIGDNNHVTDSLWQIINSIDKNNTLILDSIVEIHGFPDICMVGPRAATVVFMIVQHADTTAHNRYFPFFQQSAKAGCFKLSYLAYLTDRILMNRDFKQLFGTQLSWDDSLKTHKLIPIIDSVNIDIRRKYYGLMTLDDYLERIR